MDHSRPTTTRRQRANTIARLTGAVDAERLRIFGFQLFHNVDGFTWEGETPPGSWIQAGELQLKSFEAQRELHDDAGNVVGYECTAKFVHKRFEPPVPSVDRDERLPLLQQLVEQQLVAR